MGARLASALLGLLVVLVPLSCRRPPAGAPAASAAVPATGTLEGVVRVVGIEVFPAIALAVDNSTRSVALDGPSSLRHLDGLRVRVTGKPAGERFAVDRFTVLSANGVAATDGVLAMDGAAIALVTADGVRHPLVNPPRLLRENVGHRVWVSGPLDREVVAFGIIE